MVETRSEIKDRYDAIGLEDLKRDLKRDLPTECTTDLSHALMHLTLMHLRSALEMVGEDDDQVTHDVNIAVRMLMIMRG